MSTRTRTSVRTEDEQSSDYVSDDLFLDEVTDDDIQAFLEEREEKKEQGFWNLPTIAGLSIISVGIAYLLDQIGLALPFDFSTLVTALPWLAGVLIILLGFGVLSWTPSKKRKKEKARAAKEQEKTAAAVAASQPREQTTTGTKRRLVKSRTNKKLAGVCGGLGEYFGIDPTLIRIGFVIATVFGGGFPAIPLYIVLAIIMSNADKKMQAEQQQLRSREDRIRVVRD